MERKSKYSFKEVTFDLWKDFEKLFGDNGACGGCWCQWWRVPKGGKLWEETKGAKARRMMKKLFRSEEITGLLAYDRTRPIAWTSYGPRHDFPRTETIKAFHRRDTAEVWSVNCFFIDKDYRQEGLSRQLLEASLKFMKKRKVKIIEAYPVTLTKKGERLPAAFSYTGPLKIFEEAGFKVVQQLSPSRPLVRLTI